MGVWTQRVTCKLSDDLNFARDPLRSYFHEPQKKISYIYILFLHRFCSLFVEFWFKSWKWAAKKSYYPTCLVITFNSRHYDMTSIERYIGQSTIAFIYDVAYAKRRVNEGRSWMYEPRWSKISSSKEIAGECKYMIIPAYTSILCRIS